MQLLSEKKRPEHSKRMMGCNNPMKNKHHSKETKQKISKKNKGIKRTEEFKRKISKVTKGTSNPFYGKHHTKKTKEKISQANKGILTGKNNPNWNDGSSFEYYSSDWTNELKESIRKRDNYECQNCGMTEEEHLIVWGEVLHVHHIDYNKKNCKSDNLVSVCLSCNIRANSNRNYWKELYQNKIIEILSKKE